MKMFLLNAAVLLVCVPRLYPQELYRRYFELSGGYSRTWNGHNGWNTSFTGKPGSWIGIAGDFSGYYRHDPKQVMWFYPWPDGQQVPGTYHIKTHSFLFGPRFYLTSYERKFEPFAHVLLGMARIDKRSSVIGNYKPKVNFGWAVGGGLDFKLGNALALRLFQADYLWLKGDVYSPSASPIRLSAGIVLRFR